MDKQRLVQLFERFVKLRTESATKFGAGRILDHDGFALPKTFPQRQAVFWLMTTDFTVDLINSVNVFFYRILQADCWTHIAITLNEEERASVALEFIEPLLELSVARPYSLRNHFIFAATHLLHQSNRLRREKPRHVLPNDRTIKFETLKNVGDGWQNYPNFAAALGSLNDESFRKATHNFRHRMEHQFPLWFDQGETRYFERSTANDRTTYQYCTIEALELKSTMDSLVEQHTRALKVFSAYWTLLTELTEEWRNQRNYGLTVKEN